MEILEEIPLKLQLVKTKKGSVLYRIVVDESKGKFYLEQNPLKDSRFGYAYRILKNKYPNFYMFWEFNNHRYTNRLLLGAFLEKQEIDTYITSLLTEQETKEYASREDKSKEESEERYNELKE